MYKKRITDFDVTTVHHADPGLAVDKEVGLNVLRCGADMLGTNLHNRHSACM